MEQQQSRRSRRTSIMKKGGGLATADRSRRVSFSNKVNMKLFNKDEAMGSPAASPSRPPSSPSRRACRRLRGGNGLADEDHAARCRRATAHDYAAEQDDKENLPPASSSGTVLVMPLKEGSFQSSSSSICGGSSLLEESCFDERTRCLNESMDLTATATEGLLRPPPALSLSLSSPPTAHLSRTIILNEDLDLTATATEAVAYLEPPNTPPSPAAGCPYRQQRQQQEASSPRRVARRRSVSRRSSLPANIAPSSTSSAASSGGPSSTASPSPSPAGGGNEDTCTAFPPPEAGELEGQTVLLGTTMDLTSALDCTIDRRCVLLPPRNASPTDDLRHGKLWCSEDRTQLIDETMDFTTALPLTSRASQDHLTSSDEHTCQAADTMTMDLTTTTSSSPMAEDVTRATPAGGATEQYSLLCDKLWESIVLPEMERKQWVNQPRERRALGQQLLLMVHRDHPSPPCRAATH